MLWDAPQLSGARCFSSWICSGCSVQGGLTGRHSVSILSFLRAHHRGCNVIARWLQHPFFFFFYWYDRQYVLFTARKSYYSTLIMSLPCIFLFWLIKKFNIFICYPIAFWPLLFLMRSQLFILLGFSCMQRTFFLLPKILSLAFSIPVLCLNVAFLYFFLTCSLLSFFDMYANGFHQI